MLKGSCWWRWPYWGVLERRLDLPWSDWRSAVNRAAGVGRGCGCRRTSRPRLIKGPSMVLARRPVSTRQTFPLCFASLVLESSFRTFRFLSVMLVSVLVVTAIVMHRDCHRRRPCTRRPGDVPKRSSGCITWRHWIVIPCVRCA